MFTADSVEEVLALIKPPFEALFLYGSHARGDAQTASDVDILQVTRAHSVPYAHGRFNVTCYTVDQLVRLARRGGLFARHLVQEAIPLADPRNLLGTLKSAYVAPTDYQNVRHEVSGCAPLLDADESQFNENPKGLSSLVSYLTRSYLYALAFDQGACSFGMGHVLDLLGNQKAAAILSSLRLHNFSAFVTGRNFFEELVGTTCHRTEGSLEAFITNASTHNELAVILGLRLLARGRPFTYDALLDLEF